MLPHFGASVKSICGHKTLKLLLKLHSHKNHGPWCLLGVNWYLRFGKNRLFLVCGLLIGGILFAVSGRFRPATVFEGRKVNDNPDKFFLWTTNKSFHYIFTYDPHAADVWLFESGGGNLSESNTRPAIATNGR